MARLPSAADFNRATPQPGRQIASYQTGQVEAAQYEQGRMIAEIGEMFSKESDRLASIQAEEGLNKIKQARLDLQMGEKGFLKLRGGDVVNRPILKEYPDQFKSQIDGIINQLPNSIAKSKLTEASKAEMLGFQSDLLRHSMVESDKHELSTANATLAITRQVAAANWGNPIEVEKQWKTGINRIEDFAKSKGLSAEEVQANKQEHAGKFHEGILQAAIAGNNLSYAEKYYTEHTNELSPDDQRRFSKFLTDNKEQDTALRYSDELLSKVTGYKAQMKAVQSDFANGKIDADTRLAVERRIDHNRIVVEQIKNDGDKAMMGASQEWILKNSGKSVLEMPPNMYAWAKNTGHLAGLDSFAQREGRPGERLSELKTRGLLMQMAGEDPDAFIAEFKKTAFADRIDLGSSGIKQMQDIAASMMQGTGKYKVDFDAKIMQDAIPKDLLKSSKKDQRDAFIGLQHEAQLAWKKANPGKIPTIEEQKTIARAANAEFIEIGKFWDSTVKAYQVKEGQDNAVPRDFFNVLKARGATDSEIIKAWQIKKGVE